MKKHLHYLKIKLVYPIFKREFVHKYLQVNIHIMFLNLYKNIKCQKQQNNNDAHIFEFLLTIVDNQYHKFVYLIHFFVNHLNNNRNQT